MQDKQQKRFLGNTDFVIPDDLVTREASVVIDGIKHSAMKVVDVEFGIRMYHFEKSTDCVSLVFVKGKHLSAVMNFLDCLRNNV